MGLILGSLFLGSTLVARHYGFIPDQDNTVLAQIGRAAFGSGSPLFALLNIMTAAILILAANTSFADFPRLASILARDGYMPRAFSARGSRLVFSAGILVLTLLSCLLLVIFNATTTRLIPLYAVGVFTAFTLSQAGMVRHWAATKEAGWLRPALINGLGAAATGIVLLIVIEAKFLAGAWAILVLVPALMAMSLGIGRFYEALNRRLAVDPHTVIGLTPHGAWNRLVVVPVEGLDQAALNALAAACARSSNVVAVHVSIDPAEPDLTERWQMQLPGLPLVVIDSPYRSLAEPMAAWMVDQLKEPPHQLIVMVPSIVPRHLWERLLVGQSLVGLRSIFRGNPRVDFSEVEFHGG
jgi:hypothetical protein